MDEYKWNEFYEEFQQESPRAAVILSGAFLDSLLRDLLASFMIENDKAVDELLGSDKNPDTPLSSFGARMKTAYCLGLISKITYQDLLVIKKIRNKFAHKLHGYTFEDQEIIKLCNSLQSPNIFGEHMVKTLSLHNNRYLFTVSMLLSDLGLKILGIQSERRSTPKDMSLGAYVRVESKDSDNNEEAAAT